MSTKNHPGQFDCYEKAEPDEPMFVLLGRDPIASSLVKLWVEIRADLGETAAGKLDEAQKIAMAMEAWAKEKGTTLTAAELSRQRVMLRRMAGFMSAMAEGLPRG